MVQVMQSRQRTRVLTAFLLLVSIAFASGCGGDGGSIRVALTRYAKSDSCPDPIAPSGHVDLDNPASGQLMGDITLQGLMRGRAYVFTLQEQDRYNDLAQVSTDESGNATGHFNLPLSPRDYHVKFFVKDASNNYCIVLNNDMVNFAVK
jgi:hypothetical protein